MLYNVAAKSDKHTLKDYAQCGWRKHLLRNGFNLVANSALPLTITSLPQHALCSSSRRRSRYYQETLKAYALYHRRTSCPPRSTLPIL